MELAFFVSSSCLCRDIRCVDELPLFSVHSISHIVITTKPLLVKGCKKNWAVDLEDLENVR